MTLDISCTFGKKPIRKVTESLAEKIGRSGARRLTQEEYEAACEKNRQKAVAASLMTFEKLLTMDDETVRRFGLHSDEIARLDWDRVLPGISDGPRAVELVRPFEAQRWGMVYLGGASGQAKSLVMKIVVARALRSQVTARYVDMRDVLQDLRASFHTGYQRDAFCDRMQAWINVPVLCLDEIDKVSETDWVKQEMFYLLDKRYAAATRQETLTIVASNQGEEELSSYLLSRLRDARGGFIILKGADGRRQMEGFID
jgi:hypothetical protein